MEKKKYQVFISSTYKDLIQERRKVLEILLMADCIPAGMEAFVATDDAQFEVIKKVIDLCDYYILLIGKRYGSINEDTELSYTEMEYDYAKSKNIPVLVFAIDSSVNLPDKKIDEDVEKKYKLKCFKEKAMNNRLASIWKTNDDLVGQLAISIMRAKLEIVRPGWQRASDFDEAALRREVMELKERNEELKNSLETANAQLEDRMMHSDIAFEDVHISIEYYYYDKAKNKRNSEKKVMLKDIFKTVSTEMMDVQITEMSVLNAISKVHLSKKKYLSDDQLVKRLLNQFKALGLLTTNWNSDKSMLFWGLTESGRVMRDDLILIRKPSKIDKNEDES